MPDAEIECSKDNFGCFGHFVNRLALTNDFEDLILALSHANQTKTKIKIMADPTPIPTPKRNRGNMNHAHVAALDEADQLCIKAQKPAYAPALAARTIDTTFVTTLSNDSKTARNQLSTAVSSTTSKTTDVVGESSAETDLVGAIHEIQSAAKQKYGRTQHTVLADYHVNTKPRMDANRATLEQASQNIINKLATDTLPGITPVKVANLTTLRTAYVNSKDPTTGDQSAATGARKQLEDQIHSITDRRIQLQHAADAEWPYTNPANAGIRQEFQLPLSRPFNG